MAALCTKCGKKYSATLVTCVACSLALERENQRLQARLQQAEGILRAMLLQEEPSQAVRSAAAAFFGD